MTRRSPPPLRVDSPTGATILLVLALAIAAGILFGGKLL